MKHRWIQAVCLVLTMVLLLGSISTAFAAAPEIPVETEPPVTGTEDTGQSPSLTEETSPPTEPMEPPVTDAPPEVTEPTEQDFELDIGDIIIPTTSGASQIMPMTLPGGTEITIASKEPYYPAGGASIQFYWHSDLQPYRYGPYYTAYGSIFRLSDGRVGFCLQPMMQGGSSYEATVTGGNHIDSDGWPNAIYKSSTGTWFSWQIDRTSKRAIFLAMAYGAPNNGDTSDAGIKATALCVWDMVTGYRNVDGSERDHGTPPFYGALTDQAVKAKYDELLAKLKQHGKAPSFTVPQPSLVNKASTITLKKDAGTGLYTGSATDSNGVLANFHFTSNISGLTFTRSGNTLKVTATEAAAKQLNQLVIRSRGYELGEGTKACTVYQDKANPNSRQKLVVLDGAVDPVPCLFQLAVELEGQIQVKKTTNTGQNLSGWKFEIVDKATNKVVQTVTTDSKGLATATKLPAGQYIVREVGGGDAYWQLDTSGHTVTVVAGQTATVTVNNVHRGRIVVQKNAVNGSAQGWKFEIWQGNTLVETLTTGADGRAVSKYLLPGNYTVKEIHDRDGTYWEYDVKVEQNVTVTAGKDTTVTYTNTQYGLLQIVKTMADGISPAGWVFRVTDSTGQEVPGSPFTTGEDGVILSGKLAPGTYTVEEIIPDDSLYFCDSPNPQTVVVTAGATASVSFTNALRPGKINIQKVDTLGNPLSGAVFLLEWSTDGENWNPIVYSESIQAGGCSNPNVVDGCITTGEDGLASWENLHPGLYYRVTEVKAPNGYQLLTEPVFTGKLPIEDLTVSLRVVNAPIFTLPQTGGMDFDGFTAGIIACLGALFFMLSAGKKSRLFSYQKQERNLDMDELDLTDAEKKATYQKIKDYVLEHSGLKVSSLYIAQVKQKCGII